MKKHRLFIYPSFVATLALMLPLLGCRSVVQLSRDLEEQSRTVLLSGVVRTEYQPNDILVIATAKPEREVVAFSRLSTSGAFALVVPDSRHYWVTAFADFNGNGRWDAEEEGGEHGGDRGIWAAPDRVIPSLEIQLSERLESHEELTLPSQVSNSEAIEVRIGNLSTLDHPHLSSETGRRGLWQPLDYSREVGFGIDFLEPYDPERTGVLFVNGIGGSPQDWRMGIEKLNRARFQPWVLVYPSGSSLADIVEGTVGVLGEVERTYGANKVILVAHSMGGLIARAVADQLGSPGSRPEVRLLVTVSTPFEGHSAAGLGVRYAPAVVPAWRDLKPGSDYLQHLSKSRLRGRVPHIVFFSFGGASWLMSHSNDGTVSLASQLPAWIQEDAAVVRGFNRDHMKILADAEMLAQLALALDQGLALDQ